MLTGEKIKELRIERGLSLRKLATEAGISHTVLYRLESGETIYLRYDVMYKLAKALGVLPMLIEEG